MSLFFVWVIACTFVISQLHSFHLLSFWPNASLAVASPSHWSLTHVLGVDCKCSDVVSRYLLDRGPAVSLRENVVILGKNEALSEQLQARGFQVVSKDPNEMTSSEHALGVPFLIVNTPKNQTVYAGGYGDRKIVDGSPIQDLQLVASLQGGRTPANFPIFGCAASLKFQTLTDPFHVKYKKTEFPK